MTIVPGYRIKIWLVILLDLKSLVSLEYYSSISHMKLLLDVQEDIINSLDCYISSENRRLTDLERNLKRNQIKYQRAIKNVPNYIMNPINSYSLIRCLTTELAATEDKIYKRSEYKIRRKENLPTEVDLNGAALAISRLQIIYRLNVSEMSRGMLSEEPSSPMSACDCFEIGVALFKVKDYKNGITWMMEALNRYDVDQCITSYVSLFDIIENICFGFLKLDDKKSVIQWKNILLELRSGESEYNNFAPLIKQYQAQFAKNEASNRIVAQLNLKRRKNREDIVNNNFEVLCRNEVELSNEILKRLKCSYLRGPNPFLMLAPIKMEQLYIDPGVIMFHGVTSDTEMNYIIGKAEPKIKPSKVYNSLSDSSGITQARVSKSTTFDEDSEIIARITQRFSDMTGLSMEPGEDLASINYGIAGRYEPHYDFLTYRNLTTPLEQRQATILLYMTTVARGGATVFPALGLAVFPVKGTALYWHNLHPSGENDLDSIHASCPVLRGSKWIAVKWILNIGQELRKPCTLVYQSDKYVRKISPPKPKSPDFLFIV